VDNLFWDSNVFISFINDENEQFDIASIRQFLEETQSSPKKYRIYASTMALAEVTPGKLRSSDYGDFQEFLNDFEGVVDLIAPDPNILKLAGILKDKTYRKGQSSGRILTMGDAVMIATVVELEDTYGVPIRHFHTFDDGKGKKSPEGAKGISLLNFKDWCEGLESDPDIVRVLELDICKPIHPEKKMDL